MCCIAQAEGGELLSFPADIDILDEALTKTRSRLVVIDPIMAFLDSTVFDNRDRSVRRVLLALARLAEKHGCVILLVRHLNKRGGSRSIYRGYGAMAFLGVCRSGWLIARDPTAPTRCVLAQIKINLAAAQPSLAYTVTPNESGPPTLSWEGPTSLNADQLLGSGPSSAPTTLFDRACDFLTGFLADGPRTSREVWVAAREENLSERTIERAKRELAIRSMRVHPDGKPLSYWLLDGQTLPATTAAEEEAPFDLEPWLAPLREKFPPSTPLDEM